MRKCISKKFTDAVTDEYFKTKKRILNEYKKEERI